MKTSRLRLSRPRRRAVSDREELCTKADISSVRTKGARFDGVICAFFDGHIVLVNSSKFVPER